MSKHFLKVLIIAGIMAGVNCTTNFTNSDRSGCYGYWESNRWGLKRGTLLKNQNYSKPYRQCVDEDNIELNKEKRPYG